MITSVRPSPSEYDANYYGTGASPSSHYRGYGPTSLPHWARPMARWLKNNACGPYLDVGGAFGHLTAMLNQVLTQEGLILPNGQQTTGAIGVDWSDHAVANRVTPNLHQMDARKLTFPNSLFGTISSVDLLQCFDATDLNQVIAEMKRVGMKDHLQLHVIGTGRSNSDPVRRMEAGISEYAQRFNAAGYTIRWDLIDDFHRNPAWSQTDWVGRTLVVQYVG